MTRTAADVLEGVDELPAMPAVAARILGFSDELVSIHEMARVIATDPVLTASLLRVANSAYYGFARRLSTVHEAVLLLGFKQVRQVAVGASLISAWKRHSGAADGFDLDLFWGHSLAVAVMAETGARKFNAGRPEEAFTAGLVHDVGALALRQAMPVEFHEALAMARRSGIAMWDAELERVGFTHAELGGLLAERWNLPARIVEAVARHHEALATPASDGLAGVVAFADRVADHFGVQCGVRSVGRAPSGKLPDALATLELACGGIGSVLDRAYAFISSVSGAPRSWFVDDALAA
jgi:putative nucleotidyltransferase with HDIG domain